MVGTDRYCQALLGMALILCTMACYQDYQNNSASISCPRIVTRAEWKARKPRASQPLVHTPTPYVVVHHGGIPSYCHNQTSCSAIVRSYQNFHLDDRGWDDIGYSFVIGEDGNVYEGRGWDRVGAHAPKYNNQSIGICVIGDFTGRLPNNAALKALDKLIECGVGLDKIHREYRLVGHRQVRDTECPGETFFKHVQDMPHWTDHPVPVTNKTDTTTA